jgi:hypothetical protein
MRNRRFRTITASLAALALVGILTASAALADDGREVRKRGSCSRGAVWALEVEDEGARLEMEFDVNATIAGQNWSVKLRHDGDVFARMTKTTNAYGNFEVERSVYDGLGTDTLGARAVNLRNGEVCDGHVSI